MKHILSSIILATITIGCFAQSDYKLTGKSDKISHLIKFMPADKMVGKASEQGRDRLDSTYYLDTRIYEFPYESKKEQQDVKNLIAAILQAHDLDMPHYTGGFSASNLLRTDNPIESKRLQMYFGENIAPFVVGGRGRNYAVVRFNSKQNPYYRHVIGIEWWLERMNNKHQVVKFQTFRIFGPFSKEHYEYALKQSNISEADVETDDLYGDYIDDLYADYIGDDGPFLKMSKNWRLEGGILIGGEFTTNHMLPEVRVLAKLLDTSTDDTSKRAAVKSINKRVTILLTTATDEEKTELYRILNDIPGYYVQVTPPNGVVLTRSFAWYIDALPKLDVLHISWIQPGSPNCIYIDENNEEKPANFLLQVFLNSLDDMDILLED
ncbi:MAG: hypothetical protein IJC23_02100 [Bacteroidaceae bacterium]|nr:hypothetical protein [Bacteroidaceae bacterium]